MSRIVLFGATGYTGRLTARRLGRVVEARGREVVLAGRDGSTLERLAAELAVTPGGPTFDVALADVARPRTVRRLLDTPDDVIVSCVGPFTRLGQPAVDAAIGAGATYFDSTGEPEFLLRLFGSEQRRAVRARARLVPGFGYDSVPGELAGALAAAEALAAGTPAREIHLGYFSPGAPGVSSGTAASAVGIALGRSFAFRDGRLRREQPGRRVRRFKLGGRDRRGVSGGGTEYVDLPRMFPEIKTVGVYLCQADRFARPLQAGALALDLAMRIPLARRVTISLGEQLVRGSRGGPASVSGTSLVVADAIGPHGRPVASVVVEGPSPYDLTARCLAWASLNAGAIRGTGTLGAVQAFGLEELAAGCASFGLGPVDGS